MPPITKELSFTHDDASYLIQVTATDDRVTIQALTQDHETCGFEYAMSLPDAYYLEALLESCSIKALIDEAKNDVIDGRWRRDLSNLTKSIRAERIAKSDKMDSTTGNIVHIDEFNRPISRTNYEDYLERMDYHGYRPEGYGVGGGDIRQGDIEGKVWIYIHTRSCD